MKTNQNYRFLSVILAAGVVSPLPVLKGAEQPDYRIPLQISAPAHQGDGEHLFVGLPFPKGAVTKPGGVAIVDEAGVRVPASSRVMVRWPEQASVRWMGVEFVGDPAKRYFAIPATGQQMPRSHQVRVTEEKDGFLVQTGAARYRLTRQGALISEAWLDRNGNGQFEPNEKILSNPEGDDLYVVDHRGREGWAGRDSAPDQLRYETTLDERAPDGPLLSAEFRREGWYLTERGDRLARHVTRVSFHAGDANAYIEHRLVLTESTHRLWLTDYGIRFRYATPVQEGGVTFPKDPEGAGGTLRHTVSERSPSVHLFQEKAFYLSQMNREKDCRFEIAETDASGSTSPLHSGPLAGNWVLAQTGSGAVGVALRNLWQLYPKELQATPRSLVVRLWSPRGGRAMDFRYASMKALWPEGWSETAPPALKNRLPRINTDAAGLARTHELVLSLQPREDEKAMQTVAARIQTPAVVLASPEWLRKTEAMGRFHPYDPERFPLEEGFMETWFDQMMEVVREWGDYGFLEFGNWPHVWYQQERNGPRKGRWSPTIDRYAAVLDYGFHAHVWRMFSRSGKRKYFDAAEETIAQRFDMTMAHWDSLEPDAPLPANLRRLRGTYTFSNSPFPWAGGVAFHHNSGTDIRSLAYWHYLTGRRSPKEMLLAYGAAVKQVWSTGSLGAFRSTRPFASLKNLATVYQETGDPELLKITLEQLQWLADIDEPQGISIERETTRYGKYGVKAGAIHRVYEVTGHPLAKASLLRGATTRASTSLGGRPLTYYNSSAEQMAAAARITGDPLFLRALRRDMALAVSEYYDAEKKEWMPILPAQTYSPSVNVYPMGGMAFAMDAVVNASTSEPVDEPLTPYARQAGAGPEVAAIARKKEGQALTLELRSLHALAPEVTGPDGKTADGVQLIPFTDQLYSPQKAATRWMLHLPANLPAGDYRIASGAGYLPWEVTWSDAEGLVLSAPRGLLIGSGDRQWGNRIVAGTPDHPAPVFFRVPAGTVSFEIYSSKPARLQRQDEGAPVALEGKTWQRIPAGSLEEDTVWTVYPTTVQVLKVRGIAPVFAYGDSRRLYQPAAHREEVPAAPEPLQMVSGSPFVKVTAPDGLPQGGLLLSGGTRIQLPEASRLMAEEGVVEFWLLPEWSSSDQFRENQQARMILTGTGWELVLHRFGEMSVSALLKANGKAKPPLIETNAAAVLERGEWTHIALQWRRDGEDFVLELFVNGRPQVYGVSQAGTVERVVGFAPLPPGDLLLGARRNGAQPLDAVMAGLRFSSRPRYQKVFKPTQASTFSTDDSTLALFPFTRDLTALPNRPGTSPAVLHSR